MINKNGYTLLAFLVLMVFQILIRNIIVMDGSIINMFKSLFASGIRQSDLFLYLLPTIQNESPRPLSIDTNAVLWADVGLPGQFRAPLQLHRGLNCTVASTASMRSPPAAMA